MAAFYGAAGDFVTGDNDSFNYTLNPDDITYDDVEPQSKQIFLSVLFCDDKIGACFYREDNGRILLFADCEESAPNFETLEMLITQIEPSILLLNQNCLEAYKTKAKALMSGLKTPDGEVLHSSNGNQQPEPSVTEATSSTSVNRDTDSVLSCDSRSNIFLLVEKFFTEKFARNEIMKLNVPMSASHTDQEKFVFLSSIINVTNTYLLRSMGALLKFMELHTNGTGEMLIISGLQNFFPEQRVYVEKATIQALQVFKADWHPSNYKSGVMKDGFSVFSKFNRCVSSVGKAFMRKIFQHPLTDVATLNERFDLLSVLSDPQHIDKISLIKLNLKYIFPMQRVVQRMTVGHATIQDWKALHRTLMSAIATFELIGNCPALVANSSLLKRYVEIFNRVVITTLSKRINATINFRESTKDDLFRVNQGISQVIDSKMALLHSLSDILSREFIHDIPTLSAAAVTDAVLIYMPQIGFILKVIMPEESPNYFIDGLEFKFSSEGYSFFKSPTCFRLDDDIGDLQCDIRDEETCIMYSLQDDVLRCSRDIYDTVDRLAEIDCFIAMSEVSRENNYIRPTLNDRNEFNIIGGRHFLQECCTEEFVRNDFVSDVSVGKSKVKIITGANGCGKSIYLKQVCLISYMAQIGCFVPAESASLPIVDKIFTRIQTVESVSTKVSSFCFDLNQVSIAMRNATSRSLVALDEFGKGTSISQGVSLLAAVINYWTRSENTPHILISTHLLSLPKLLTQSPKIVYETFEVVVEEDKVSYMYKLKNGIAESSFGASVARMVAVPHHVIARANFVTESLAAGHKFPPLRDEKYDAYITRCIEVGKRFRELNILKQRDPAKKIKEFIQSLRDSNAHVI